ncbi:MAG: hypothetical protein H6581_00440 [Bacteroidia bacterium]|nr:hypothetical protein [Bacteroidia bacterium]
MKWLINPTRPFTRHLTTIVGVLAILVGNYWIIDNLQLYESYQNPGILYLIMYPIPVLLTGIVCGIALNIGGTFLLAGFKNPASLYRFTGFIFLFNLAVRILGSVL